VASNYNKQESFITVFMQFFHSHTLYMSVRSSLSQLECSWPPYESFRRAEHQAKMLLLCTCKIPLYIWACLSRYIKHGVH